MSGLYRYRWDRQGRKGQPCSVLARGKMNSCLVEFLDGYKMITSRNALARWRHPTPPAFTATESRSDGQ